MRNLRDPAGLTEETKAIRHGRHRHADPRCLIWSG
jgi:hypothetical protein